MTSPDAAVWACLSVMPRSVKLTPPTNTPIDIGYQRRDDFAEGRTDYDTDGQIDHIAPHGELLEFVYEFAFHNTRF